ncbi:uncharacterized protein C9orf85 homolog [Hyalella azteca]|uniref:Uncharacterized protein C9orf85 homolog n=1 Tax=Hyalella azteca TaxID=294128 RepID=A0A8B7NVH5_HYAAZ|nr:uncharacterized protein C9orf85 homolog [Hyalella azteca]
MSSQRGNVVRTRPQKHKNKKVFDNLRFDTNHRSKMIAELDVVQVCETCNNIIEWKIKYKKYKPLSQPKTCTKCSDKTIVNAYHTVCLPCATSLGICCKCAKEKKVVKEAPPDERTQLKEKSELEAEVRRLPVRRRKAFWRFMDNANGIGPKVDITDLDTDEALASYEQRMKREQESCLPHNDYMKLAYRKLEQLKRHTKLRMTLADDFDDLSLGDDDDDEDDDDEDDDESGSDDEGR